MEKKTLFKVLTLVFTLLLVAGCAGGGKTEGEAGKKPLPNLPQGQSKPGGQTQTGPTGKIDAKTAYEKLSNYAKSQWSPDAVLLILTAPYRPMDSIENGTCISWTSAFYSPSKKQSWFFHYYSGQVYKAGSPNYKDVDLSYVDIKNFANSPEVYEKAVSAGASDIKNMSLVAGMTSPYSKIPSQVGSLKLYWEIQTKNDESFYFDGISLNQLK